MPKKRGVRIKLDLTLVLTDMDARAGAKIKAATRAAAAVTEDGVRPRANRIKK